MNCTHTTTDHIKSTNLMSLNEVSQSFAIVFYWKLHHLKVTQVHRTDKLNTVIIIEETLRENTFFCSRYNLPTSQQIQ